MRPLNVGGKELQGSALVELLKKQGVNLFHPDMTWITDVLLAKGALTASQISDFRNQAQIEAIQDAKPEQ